VTDTVNNDPKVPKENAEMQDMENLMEQYGLKTPEKDSLIEGRVIKVLHDVVVVDVGYKQEGLIPLHEYQNYKGEVSVKEGDKVVAVVNRITPHGSIYLSKKEAEQRVGFDKVDEAFNKELTIEGTVISRVEDKGMIVDIGLPLFLPLSQADLHPVSKPDDLIGKTFSFKILKWDPKNRSGVLSRKVILQAEAREKRDKLLQNVKVGDDLSAKVIRVIKDGAIVEIDGALSAFVPKSEISWGHLPDIRRKLKPNETYTFRLLELDPEKDRIILSLKALEPDPWLQVPEKYPTGTKIRGKVIHFKEDYAVVELEEGVEARLSGEDIYWGKKIKSPKYVLEMGDKVIGKVLDSIPEKRLLFIGLKQLEPSPWEKFMENFKVGDQAEVRVKKLADSGVIVNIVPDVDGFIRKGDLSWGYVEHPSEVVKAGDTLKALILSIEKENGRILLGVKQTEGDKWVEFFAAHKEGEAIDTKVKKILDNFAVVEFPEGLEGIVRINEIAQQRVEKIADVLTVGESKPARIIKIDRPNRKVLVSYKKLEEEQSRREIESMKKIGVKEHKISIGGLIQEELSRKKV